MTVAPINPACVLLSEKWIKKTLSSALVDIPGYQLVRADREGKGGGGVAVYIRDDLRYKTVCSSPVEYNGPLEYLFIEIFTCHRKMLVEVMYRAPKLPYIIELENIFADHIINYDDVLLIGDINTNYMSVDCTEREKLQSVLSSHNLTACLLNLRITLIFHTLRLII